MKLSLDEWVEMNPHTRLLRDSLRAQHAGEWGDGMNPINWGLLQQAMLLSFIVLFVWTFARKGTP